MLRPGEKIGVITANGKTLTPEHLRIATGGMDVPLAMAGMEDGAVLPVHHAPVIVDGEPTDADGRERFG